MNVKKFVNANKEGQDYTKALLTNVGDIVNVRYNESKKRIEFYRDNGYLGSTPSKEKLEGYAQVKKIESLFKGFHFTLDFYEGLSEEEMLEKEQRDLIESNKRKEKLRESIEKDKQDRIARLKASTVNSTVFANLVDSYNSSKSDMEGFVQSSASDKGDRVNSVNIGKSLSTEDEVEQSWLSSQLQFIKYTEHGKYLYELNEKGELLSFVREHSTKRQKDRVTRLKATVENSEVFTNLVNRYNFSKSAREASIESSVSDIFKMVGSVITGKSLPTEDEVDQKWLSSQLQNVKNTEYGKYLYDLNEKGELVSIIRAYSAKEQQRVIPSSFSYQRYQGRFTHCWKCGSTLTSESHSKCRSCKWLICSCGACKKGCSTN